MILIKEHIGGLIKSKLIEDGRSVKWLANKIHCKRRNIYDIFIRTSIDAAQLLRISLALRINFFLYFCEIYETKIEDVESNTLISVQEGTCIGDLVRSKLKDYGRSVKWLAEKIHCKRSNIYNIFNNRASIDTALLLKVSLALKMNFFEYYCIMYKNAILTATDHEG